MSKSATDPNSRILITDDALTISKRIRSAVTDSIRPIAFDPEGRPGTSNLLTIFAGCTGEDVQLITERYRDKGHGDLKRDLVDVVEEMVKGPRSEYHRLQQDPGFVRAIADHGTEKARALSQVTMKQIRKAVGLW